MQDNCQSIIWKATAKLPVVWPELEDREAQGETDEVAAENIRQAIRVRIEDSLGDNEDISQAETVNFTTLRLSA